MGITHLPLAELLASTEPEHFSARRSLSEINVRIAKARKVVVVSGAGISCSSGIPDFRSDNGLYALVKERYPDQFVTGKDLFSSGLFNNPTTTSVFYSFIAELSLACQAAHPTRTHHFIRRLEQKGKLLRSYTQNVDGFERRLGMESGGRGRGLKKIGTRNVELHGDLGRVRCVLCFTDYEAKHEWVETFRQGEAPSCPACEERCMSRMSRSARAISIGTLRPSIVLYDEPHPLGDEIGQLQAHDLKRGPDVLLIMGTSLKVHGLKRLVKDFAKAVHGKKGLVVFINATSPSKEWDGIIDYHVQGDTDCWVERVEDEWKKVRPQDWEIQTILDNDVVHGSVAKPAKKKRAPKPQPRVVPPHQLPTPPASQQSPAPSSPPPSTRSSSPLSAAPSSPRRSPRLRSSSPLSSPPSTPTSRRCSRAATPVAPPTPVSPSKRSNSVIAQRDTIKKTKVVKPPTTGVAGALGRGNLFAESTKVNLGLEPPSSDDTELFSIGAKTRNTRSRAASRPPGTKAVAPLPRPRTRASTVEPKFELVVPRARQPTASQSSNGRQLRRVPSLRV